MERVRGIGGYFLRARDPEGLSRWYRDNLGVVAEDLDGYWFQQGGPTVFAPFPEETDYFGSPAQKTMLNFRVVNLDAMLAQLKAGGAEVDHRIETDDNGRFGWAVDPEGNRFELWEPVDGISDPGDLA